MAEPQGIVEAQVIDAQAKATELVGSRLAFSRGVEAFRSARAGGCLADRLDHQRNLDMVLREEAKLVDEYIVRRAVDRAVASDEHMDVSHGRWPSGI